ncbi:hypothetical protein V5P93_004699 [Actinokineospora auranticolor]|uniref:LamG-like jellyroll fold domain-containing protein n=1 Tax=Actinokineospora auranticolor TaxID=155976 RepID=UPI000CEC69E2
MLIACLAAGAVLGVVEPAAAEKAPGTPAVAAPDADLAAKARRTGKAQEVPDRTNETSQVFVEPDGSYRLHKTALPTRVRKGNTWRDIDTTLAVRPDGMVAPAASTADVAFSGGGDGPAITFTDGDKQLALHWKGTLPKPALDGARATYRDVLPGVDLRLTAESTNFSQVLVVHSAEAAKQPGLAELRFTAVGSGVTVRSTDDGAFTAVGADGATVFQGSTPVMWDSTTDQQAGPARIADGFGAGRVAKVRARTEPAAAKRAVPGKSTLDMVITPDQQALTGPEVRYPVYIDPIYSKSKANFAGFTSNGWYYFDVNMLAQVGYCNWGAECGAVFVARSFFRFTTPELQARNGRQAVLHKSFFYAWQAHGTSCTDEQVALYHTGEYSGATRWPGPSGYQVSTAVSHAGDQCGGTASVAFNANAAVQTTINTNASTMVLALMSPNEGNKYQWKKFINNPALDIYFSFPPQMPTGLGLQNGVLCDNRLISPTSTPTVLASAVDNNDPPLNISLGYQLFNYPGNQVVHSGSTTIASGATGAWTAPAPVGDGAYYARVSSTNIFPGEPGYGLGSGATQDLWFDVMAAPLTKTPVVRESPDYPRGQWGAQAGSPGDFRVSYEGGGIVGFAYTFNGSGTQAVPATTDCDYDRAFGTSGGWVSSAGEATIPVPKNLSPGRHTLHVKAFDMAHKMSAESQVYEFWVAPNLSGAGQVWLEAENLVSSQPPGQNRPLTPQNNCCSTVWSGGAQLMFQGNAAGQSFTMDVPVATAGDYLVGTGLTTALDYGTTTFKLDGVAVGQTGESSPLGTPVDNFDPTRVRHRHVTLGAHRLTAGTHKITVTVAGTNPGSVGARYFAGVDYVSLGSTTRLEAENDVQVPVTQPAGQNLAVTVSPTDPTSGGKWSQGAARGVVFTAAGQQLRAQFTAPIAADYSIGLGALSDRSAAKFTYRVDDVVLNRTDTQPWGRGTPNPDTVEHVALGGLHLAAGTHTLSVTLATGDPAADEAFWLDYLRITPITGATAADFASAMNNKGTAVGGSVADLDFQGYGMTPQSLADIGLAPGSAKTVDGATFVLPAATAAGDNVVALGQKIPFPAAQQVKANAVGLLALSTCGNSRATTATLTYTDGTTQNPVVPAVPDWLESTAASPLPALANLNANGYVQTAMRPRVHAVFMPADPSKTLQSITLPNYGTSMAGSCGEPALHVLAMAPRNAAQGWVGTWGAPADAVTAPPGGAGFANQTLRTIVRPTVTGPRVRVRLSNPFTKQAVTIGAATLGAQTGATPATLATPVALTFGGAAAVTIPAGGEVVSDDVAYPSTTGGSGALVVSTHITGAVAYAPVHALTTSPSYLASGNQAAQSAATTFSTLLTGTHYLSGVEVSTSTPGDASKGTVVVVGDQFTGSTPNNWVDRLPAALAAQGESVPGGLVDATRRGVPLAGAWRLNEGSGTTAADSSGAGATGTLSGPVGWSAEHGGAAVFNGSSTVIQTSGPLLDTMAPYTVSAWAKVTSATHFSAVVSQSQTWEPTFVLEYNSAVGAWSLTAPNQDTSAPSAYPAARSGPAPLNTWTHLVGTVDPATGDMALYVNGVLAGTAKNPTPFATSGPLTIGGVKNLQGRMVSMFEGQISDVRVYRHLASAEDAGILYAGGAPTGPTAGVGAATLVSAASRMNDTVFARPSLRTAVVSVGANDILAGASKATLLSRVGALTKAANTTSARSARRVDGSLVHVIVTTIAPMGLAANDPRELVRREYNAELLANYGNLEADGVIDVAAAVQDPGNIQSVAPAFLTSGAPNGGYHQAVADVVAAAVATFPPVEL